jgi:tRNA(Ile)-lysidine synthase TilS/MesJ
MSHSASSSRLSIKLDEAMEQLQIKLLCHTGETIVVIRPLSAVQVSDLVRYAELRTFPIIRCDLCGTQEDFKRKQKRNFCADGRDSRLAVQTASSSPCRTWRRRFSWTDDCSTSWVCAHPTRRKERKTPGWIKTLPHPHEPHKSAESLEYQRHLTKARISPQ